MKIRLLLLLLALFAIPCFVLAAEQEEPTVYVIKRGDTLWGLSERFLQDPYYWPDMWAKNKRITNPHLIYPGQKLRVFPDRLEVVEAAQTPVVVASKAAAVVPVEPLQEVAAEKSYPVYGSEGFLMEKELKPAGTIVGVHHDRVLAGVDDIVYTDIGAAQGAKSGDKFLVFRRDVVVSHPVTSEVLGTKITGWIKTDSLFYLLPPVP